MLMNATMQYRDDTRNYCKLWTLDTVDLHCVSGSQEPASQPLANLAMISCSCPRLVDSIPTYNSCVHCTVEITLLLWQCV